MLKIERARKVRDIRERIYAEADPTHLESLKIDDNYGAPYSFWQTALGFGLVTRDEVDMAREHYADLWHYRGD